MVTEEYAVKKVIMGTVPEGEDLQTYMAGVIREYGITAAQVTVLGALSQANVGYFNYKTNEYEFSKYRRTMTIASCAGTVRMLDDNHEIHLHISLSDHDGGMYGGHLMEESIVKSAEFSILVFA